MAFHARFVADVCSTLNFERHDDGAVCRTGIHQENKYPGAEAKRCYNKDTSAVQHQIAHWISVFSRAIAN